MKFSSGVNLVVELVARTAGTGAEGVATLDHEAGDHAVEDGAVVEGTGGLLAGRGVDPFALALARVTKLLTVLGAWLGNSSTVMSPAEV